MNVFLTDEQTLGDFSNGLNLKVDSVDIFRANGFFYKVFTLNSCGLKTNLFIVQKGVSETECDTYVCFEPVGLEAGDRNDFDFLFDGNYDYIPQIENDEGQFNRNLSVNVEVEMDTFDELRPGFATEYQGTADCLNPRAFVFEICNTENDESLIQFLLGVLVNKKEVTFL